LLVVVIIFNTDAFLLECFFYLSYFFIECNKLFVIFIDGNNHDLYGSQFRRKN